MLLFAAAAAAASREGPAKLVIIFGSGGIAITDYPSADRCESARRGFLATVRAGKPSDDGKFKFVYSIDAWCIPG